MSLQFPWQNFCWTSVLKISSARKQTSKQNPLPFLEHFHVCVHLISLHEYAWQVYIYIYTHTCFQSVVCWGRFGVLEHVFNIQDFGAIWVCLQTACNAMRFVTFVHFFDLPRTWTDPMSTLLSASRAGVRHTSVIKSLIQFLVTFVKLYAPKTRACFMYCLCLWWYWCFSELSCHLMPLLLNVIWVYASVVLFFLSYDAEKIDGINGHVYMTMTTVLTLSCKNISSSSDSRFKHVYIYKSVHT